MRRSNNHWRKRALCVIGGAFFIEVGITALASYCSQRWLDPQVSKWLIPGLSILVLILALAVLNHMIGPKRE